MAFCLQNGYAEETAQFTEAMRADPDTVRETYHFHDTLASLDKNFVFDPPPDPVTCHITINDAEDDSCMSDWAIFHTDLELIDDVICK